MTLYTKIIGIYKFDELNNDAKAKAIDDHRTFLLSIMEVNDFISGDPNYDTPESLQDMYDIEYDYISFNDEPVIESIEANDYDFYENGDIAPQKELLSMTKMWKEKTWEQYHRHILLNLQRTIYTW